MVMFQSSIRIKAPRMFHPQAGYHSPLQSRSLAEALAESASKRLGSDFFWEPFRKEDFTGKEHVWKYEKIWEDWEFH
jgi:hypothetical protein